MNSAIQEAEFGNAAWARRETIAALKMASTRDVRVLASLVLARSGDSVGAEKMADDLARQFPLNTVIQSYWLPTIRAAIEINLGQADKAIENLGRAHDYELGGPNPELESGRFLYPTFVRGYAYLRARNGREAESEFGMIVQHPGSFKIVLSEPSRAWALPEPWRCRAMAKKRGPGMRNFSRYGKMPTPTSPN
jgi:eukaryotic-like serine/threonine-protein kinase